MMGLIATYRCYQTGRIKNRFRIQVLRNGTLIQLDNTEVCVLEQIPSTRYTKVSQSKDEIEGWQLFLTGVNNDE